MAFGLSAGRLGRFAGDEHHSSAGGHLRLAAGAVRHGGEHGAVSVATAWGRPLPVDGEIPPAPQLLHLSLDLNSNNHTVHQKPSGRPCSFVRRMFAPVAMNIIAIKAPMCARDFSCIYSLSLKKSAR